MPYDLYRPGLAGWNQGLRNNAIQSGTGLNNVQGILAIDKARREREMQPLQQMLEAAKIQNQLASASNTAGGLAKINPKDYTPESFAAFQATGDPTKLRAREKIVADNLGNELRYRTEYSTSPQGTATMGINPGTARTNELREESNALTRADVMLRNQSAVDQGMAGVTVPGPVRPGGGILANQPPAQIPAQQRPAPQAPAVQPQASPPPGVSPRDWRKRIAEQPAATSAYRNAMQGLEQMEALTDEVLGGYVGGVTGIRGQLPDIPGGKAANTRANLETLKVKVGFATLQAMREASKTGGALGQISEREGEWLQNALVSLQSAQSEEQVRAHLQQIKDHISGLKAQYQEAYRATYGTSPVALNPALGGGGAGPDPNDPLGIRSPR